MLSPQLLSHVFLTIDILMLSPQLLSHVVPRPAIPWSPELQSPCGPQNWHPYVVSTIAIAYGPKTCHHMWSPDLPSHGPQNCIPHVVPRTDILCNLKNWSELSPSHNNYCPWRKSTVCCPVRRQLLTKRTCAIVKKMISISTVFFGKHNRLFNTCRNVNSYLYRLWSHIRIVPTKIHKFFKLVSNSGSVRMFCWFTASNLKLSISSWDLVGRAS